MTRSGGHRSTDAIVRSVEPVAERVTDVVRAEGLLVVDVCAGPGELTRQEAREATFAGCASTAAVLLCARTPEAEPKLLFRVKQQLVEGSRAQPGPRMARRVWRATGL
jgi:hypothetical protein